MKEILKTYKSVALSATAGSGKTRALTLRFLSLYLKGAPLASLYGITFTNKAALELKRRILRYLELLSEESFSGEEEKEIISFFTPLKEIKKTAREKKEKLLVDFSDLNVSTIHSFFATLLRAIPFQAGILPGFRIIDEVEEEMLLEEILDEFFRETETSSELRAWMESILDPRESSIKARVKKVFLSLFPRFPEIEEKLKEGKENIEHLRKKKRRIFSSLEEKIKKILVFLENQKKINLHLFRLIQKIKEALRGREEEKVILWLTQLFTKSYYQKLIKELEKEGEDTLWIETLREAFLKEAREYSLLRNQEYLLGHILPVGKLKSKLQRRKLGLNVLGFNDLESLTFSTLRGREDVSYLYFKTTGEIRHLLIDEFQDTSLLQWRILEPIVEEISSGEGSFFYVGDPNQAIYRFRGGEPKLFFWVRERFPEKIEAKRLKKNFRSKKELVEFVNLIFSPYPEYKPMEPHQGGGGWIRVEDLGECTQKEGMEKVKKRMVEGIKELIEKRGYEPSQIAILVRRNSVGQDFSQVLTREGIPNISESRMCLLGREEVRDMLNLLRWLDSPQEDFWFAQTLLSPLFSLSPEEIRSFKRKEKTLYLVLKDEYPQLELTQKLNLLLSRVGFLTPYSLLAFIYSELGVAEKYLETEPLLKLLELAGEFERQGQGSLPSFLEFVEKKGRVWEARPGIEEGVNILTVHKAKGLEFEVVILPELCWRMEGEENEWFIFSYGEEGEGFRLKDIYWRKDPLFPLFWKEELEKEKERVFRDELNNFYVALTRAKEGLWLFGYTNSRIKNSWFELIKRALQGKIKQGKYWEGEIPLKEEKRPPLPERKEERTLRFPPLRKERRLFSFTPREVEPLTEEKRYAFRWGAIYHKALSYIGWVEEEELERLVKRISQEMKRLFGRGKEGEEIEKRVSSLLETILGDGSLKFLFYRGKRRAKVKTEVPLYFEGEREEVSGIVDRLIIEPGFLLLVDYKSGGEEEKHREQLLLYGKGLKKIYPSLPQKLYLLYLEKPPGKRLKEVTALGKG